MGNDDVGSGGADDLVNRGPAVIAGHGDSKRGPAVFFRLPRGRGDQIFVDRADGTTAMFATQPHAGLSAAPDHMRRQIRPDSAQLRRQHHRVSHSI